MAQEVNKPVIIHMREENDAWFGQASMDLLEILSEWHAQLMAESSPLVERPGVLHSYNGNLETAQKALALNFFIGVTGPVTYKNAEEKRQIIRQLPLERLLVPAAGERATPDPPVSLTPYRWSSWCPTPLGLPAMIAQGVGEREEKRNAVGAP